MNRKVLGLLAVALIVLLVGRAQRHEPPVPAALPVSAGGWTARADGATFTETGSYGGQQVALAFTSDDATLTIIGPAGRLPTDDDVPFHATFQDNSSFAFDGDGSNGNNTVQADVGNDQMAGFTRHLTGGGSMVLSFDDQQTAPLVFPLDGAGTTFQALAAAMHQAGLAGRWGESGPGWAGGIAAVFGLGIGWFFTVLAVLYFLPAVIAYTRGSAHAGVILLLNLLVGWTVIGWWALLVFAMVSPARTRLLSGPR